MAARAASRDCTAVPTAARAAASSATSAESSPSASAAPAAARLGLLLGARELERQLGGAPLHHLHVGKPWESASVFSA